MRQIVLDTETTGLSPEKGHRIIEVGCLELVNRRLTNNNLHFYINPKRMIDKAAEEVHGITEEFLSDKPYFEDIAAQLIDYLKDAELIIHNAPFDVGFLDHELKLLKGQYGLITDYCGVIDTLALARRKHPGQHNSLDALCRRYSVDNTNRDLHGALLDAELLAQVYLLMTGGQTQLFAADDNEESFTANKVEVERFDRSHVKLPIIQADTQELDRHQQFLKKLPKRGGDYWN